MIIREAQLCPPHLLCQLSFHPESSRSGSHEDERGERSQTPTEILPHGELNRVKSET